MKDEERKRALLYSTDSREELCGRICGLEALVLDCMSVALSMTWQINHAEGLDSMEPGSVATVMYRNLEQRAKRLEVPDA